VQGVQLHDGVPIVHSLGNFVFDMDFSRQTEEGVLAEVVFWGGQLKAMRFVPYVIDADFTPRLNSGPRARRTLNRMWSASDPPFNQ
jgi:poly-gamma-glutamate synthesis protein (capsule biosynthesis protein)